MTIDGIVIEGATGSPLPGEGDHADAGASVLHPARTAAVARRGRGPHRPALRRPRPHPGAVESATIDRTERPGRGANVAVEGRSSAWADGYQQQQRPAQEEIAPITLSTAMSSPRKPMTA
jgi:hypothetical protein